MNEQLDQNNATEAVTAPPRRSNKWQAKSARPAHHAPQIEDEPDSFFARHGAKVIIGAIVALGATGAFFLKPGKSTPAPKAPERIVSIQLPPMPPPPPPKKVPPPPPKQEKMVEQAPVAAQEKPAEAPKPKAAAPAPLGTGIKGDGPGLSGLGGSGEGGGVFGGTGGGGGGSKWGFFAGQVQSRVAEALRTNKATKSANLKVQVRIWSDSTGRVTRVKLDGSTGDPKLDAAIQNEVLNGLQLTQPPPAGMPMPIVMRLAGRRP